MTRKPPPFNQYALFGLRIAGQFGGQKMREARYRKATTFLA
jgi:hypothetical protein